VGCCGCVGRWERGAQRAGVELAQSRGGAKSVFVKLFVEQRPAFVSRGTCTAAHQMQPPSQPVPDPAFLAQLKALHDQGISLDELFRQKMGSAAQEPSADMTQSPQAPGSPVEEVIPPVSESAESLSEVARLPALGADPAPPVPPSIVPQESEEDKAAEAERPVTPEWMARKAKERMKDRVRDTQAETER